MRMLTLTLVRTCWPCGVVALPTGMVGGAVAEDGSTEAADSVSPRAPVPSEPTAAEDALEGPEGDELAPEASHREPTPCAKQPGIALLEENVYAVDPARLSAWRGDLLKLGAASEHRDATTRRVGARLRLPRCSPLRQAGLRTGDILWRVNGWPAAYVVEATWGLNALMLGSLKSARRFTFVMTRRGEPITVRWRPPERSASTP